MVITTLPTASAIRIESRLRPEQVSTAMADVAALEADITGRIAKYRPVIERAIRPVATSTNATIAADDQIMATQALFLRVEASLYGTAGYLNPSYWTERDRLKAESDELIALLLGSETDTAGTAGTGAGTLTTAPYRVVDDLLVVNG